MSSEKGEEKSLSMLQVIGSVLAAGFGVQSEKNRERDFKTGSSRHFIVVGLVATILFVITLYTIVRLVLAFAGV